MIIQTDQKYLKPAFLVFSFILLASVISLSICNSFMINSGSAKNPCNDPLLELQNLTMYNDECFFQPPESAIIPLIEQFSAFGYPHWRIPRHKGVELCKTYNAYMPQLKNNNVTEAFFEAIQSNKYELIPLGLTIKNISYRFDNNVITWDSDPAIDVVIPSFAIHGNRKRYWIFSQWEIFMYGWKNYSSYMDTEHGYWNIVVGVYNPRRTIRLFCHYIPKSDAGNINASNSEMVTSL